MKNEDNNKDQFLKEHFKNDKNSQFPSSNFTHKVMDKIEKESKKPSIKPLPIFGLAGWFFSSLFAILIGLSIYFAPENSTNRIHLNIDLTRFKPLVQSETTITFFFIIAAISVLILLDKILLKKLK